MGSFLLQAGANPNGRDKNNSTPLMYAARDGHLPCVQLLLHFGADPIFKDNHGWTAIMYAKDVQVKELLEQWRIRKEGIWVCNSSLMVLQLEASTILTTF